MLDTTNTFASTINDIANAENALKHHTSLVWDALFDVTNAIDDYLLAKRPNISEKNNLLIEGVIRGILFARQLTYSESASDVRFYLDQANNAFDALIERLEAAESEAEEKVPAPMQARPQVSTKGFRVGDKVRCVDDGGYWTIDEGDIYTVSKVGGRAGGPVENDPGFIQLEETGTDRAYYDTRFEAVTEERPAEALNGLKVGDRVRCVDAGHNYSIDTGEEYVISAIGGTFDGLINNPQYVQVEGVKDSAFCCDRFEKIEEPKNPLFKVGDYVRFKGGEGFDKLLRLVEGRVYKVVEAEPSANPQNGGFLTLEGFGGKDRKFGKFFEAAEEWDYTGPFKFEVGQVVVGIEDNAPNNITKGRVYDVIGRAPYDPDLVRVQDRLTGKTRQCYDKRFRLLDADYRIKEGDTVKCVDAEKSFGMLRGGQTYTVSRLSLSNNELWLAGVHSNSWRQRRFEIAQIAE